MTSAQYLFHTLFLAANRSVSSYLYFQHCYADETREDAARFIGRIRDRRASFQLPVQVLAYLTAQEALAN